MAAASPPITRRVGADVTLTPHRPGRADFPLPVLQGRASLTVAYRWPAGWLLPGGRRTLDRDERFPNCLHLFPVSWVYLDATKACLRHDAGRGWGRGNASPSDGTGRAPLAEGARRGQVGPSCLARRKRTGAARPDRCADRRPAAAPAPPGTIARPSASAWSRRSRRSPARSRAASAMRARPADARRLRSVPRHEFVPGEVSHLATQIGRSPSAVIIRSPSRSLSP